MEHLLSKSLNVLIFFYYSEEVILVNRIAVPFQHSRTFLHCRETKKNNAIQGKGMYFRMYNSVKEKRHM